MSSTLKVTPSVSQYAALQYAADESGSSYEEMEAAFCDFGGLQGDSIQIDVSEDFFGNVFAETIQEFMVSEGYEKLIIRADS